MGTIGIIVIVVIALGFIGIIVGPIMASKNGDKAGSAFAQAYRQEFGTAPSAAAEQAIARATAVILNAMGSGQYAYPSENLRKCIREYGAAVNWSESKMELGLGCLLAICSTKNMTVAPGCQWAADVIVSAIAQHCPTMSRRALGY